MTTRIEWLMRALLAGVVIWLLFSLHQSIKRQGWNERNAEVLSEKASAVTAALVTLQQSVNDARERDRQVLASLEDQLAKSEMRASSLQARMRLQSLTPYQPTSQESVNAQGSTTPSFPFVGQSILDDGTVRMLNDARAGIGSGPEGSTGRGSEESSAFTATPPYVTGSELVLNDHKVVTLYHQLATRHNALVDWVEAQCARSTAVTP